MKNDYQSIPQNSTPIAADAGTGCESVANVVKGSAKIGFVAGAYVGFIAGGLPGALLGGCFGGDKGAAAGCTLTGAIPAAVAGAAFGAVTTVGALLCSPVSFFCRVPVCDTINNKPFKDFFPPFGKEESTTPAQAPAMQVMTV